MENSLTSWNRFFRLDCLRRRRHREQLIEDVQHYRDIAVELVTENRHNTRFSPL